MELAMLMLVFIAGVVWGRGSANSGARDNTVRGRFDRAEERRRVPFGVER